jgi:hypothetical protein
LKKFDETLPIINKSKHPKKKGRNTKNKKEGPTSKKKTIESSKKANRKGRNIKFSNPLLFLQEALSNKERGAPFEMETTSSLENPPPIAIACFKIEIAYARCNVIDIFCL